MKNSLKLDYRNAVEMKSELVKERKKERKKKRKKEKGE